LTGGSATICCSTGRKGAKLLARVPLVLTFSRALPNVGSILRRHLPTLHRSDEIKQVFPEVLLVAFRRDSNIQDILVHKKHNRQFFNQGNSCGPCGAERCAVCPYIVAADTFTSAEGVTYKVRNKMTCKSTNVVYAVFCKRCDRYVYEMLEKPGTHFYTDGPSVADYSVMGLKKLNGSAIYCRAMEQLWKDKLRTYRPYGINVKE